MILPIFSLAENIPQRVANNQLAWFSAEGDGSTTNAFVPSVTMIGSAESYTSKSFELAVKMGQVPGFSTIDKFGENPDIDTGTVPEDIWEGGGVYIYDPDGTAPIVSLASSNAGDTEPIQITGLDINGAEVNQTITLSGTTRVALITPLWRVYRMQNEGTSDLVGIVFCYTGTGTVPSIGDPEVRAIIDNGNNQTLMALYTIPLGKVGFLYRGETLMSRSQTSGAVQGSYQSRRFGKIFKVKKRVDIVNSGSSSYQDKRSFPDVIPSLTDIKLRVENVSANNAGITGTFDILLIDETLFSTNYLQEIGQPGY